MRRPDFADARRRHRGRGRSLWRARRGRRLRHTRRGRSLRSSRHARHLGHGRHARHFRSSRHSRRLRHTWRGRSLRSSRHSGRRRSAGHRRHRILLSLHRHPVDHLLPQILYLHLRRLDLGQRRLGHARGGRRSRRSRHSRHRRCGLGWNGDLLFQVQHETLTLDRIVDTGHAAAFDPRARHLVAGEFRRRSGRAPPLRARRLHIRRNGRHFGRRSLHIRPCYHGRAIAPIANARRASNSAPRVEPSIRLPRLRADAAASPNAHSPRPIARRAGPRSPPSTHIPDRAPSPRTLLPAAAVAARLSSPRTSARKPPVPNRQNPLPSAFRIRAFIINHLR